MTYLYSLLGITTWIIAVAFSSNALISHENSTQAENIKKKVGLMSEQITQRKIINSVSIPLSSDLPTTLHEPTIPTKNTTVMNRSVVPQKKAALVPVRKYEREEDRDDD